MTHLTPEELLDVAEGCGETAHAAHAASCESCRERVAGLQDALRLAKSDSQPEPSPLFLERLAARIGTAVRRERPQPHWWGSWGWQLASLGAMALLAIAIGIGSPIGTGTPGDRPLAPAAPAAAPTQVPTEASAETDTADDPSWLLVSELSEDVAFDDVEATEPLPSSGVADRALLQLDESERIELARILRQELARPALAAPKGSGA